MAAMKVWYDQEGDILEVTFDEAPAFLEEIGDDVLERRAVDGRVVGVMVMNFSKHDRANLVLPLAVTAVEVGEGPQ